MGNSDEEGYTIYRVVYPDPRVPERESVALFYTPKAAKSFCRRQKGKVEEVIVTRKAFMRLRRERKLEF